MKKTFTYLKEQVTNRLASSMFLFADKKYSELKKQNLKGMIFFTSVLLISGAGFGLLFMNILPRILEALILLTSMFSIIGSLVLIITCLCHFFHLKSKHNEFKNLDFSNSNEIINRFNQLFYNKESEKKQFEFHQYGWNNFDLNLTQDEISYLLESSLNNEQIKCLKETIFKKESLDFNMLKQLELLSIEREKAIDDSFKEFLTSNNHKTDSLVSESNKEHELEVAYNKYI